MSAYPVVVINSRNERVVFPDAAMRRGALPTGLFDHATADAGATAAQWLRLVAVIVAADMDHHRFGAQYRHILDMRRGQGLHRAAVSRDLQDRKVAEPHNRRRNAHPATPRAPP